MKINLYFIIFLSLHFISGGLFAQSNSDQIKFVQLSTKDGLSQGSVFSITQDHLDLIWIGTRDGLNKYNAHEFITYRNVLTDSTSLSNNYVTAVFEDKEKNLWVGTGQGVNLYDRSTDKFIRIKLSSKGVSEPFVYSITQDKSDKIWFSTSTGLYLLSFEKNNALHTTLIFNGQNIPHIHFPGGSGNVQQIYQDSRGRHWLSTTNGVYVFKGLATGKTPELIYNFQQNSSQLNSADVRFSYEMKPGVFWMGTRGGGINVFEETTQKFTYITTESTSKDFTGLSSNDVRSILFDKNSKGYWIGTINGLNYFKENQGFISFYKEDDNSYSIADNSIRPIFQDRRGSIWVGTYYGGVSVYDKHLGIFKHYEKDNKSDQLSHNVVSGIMQDNKGGYWIGYEGGGLDYTNSSHHIVNHYQNRINDPSSLSNNHVKNIYLDKVGNLWVGTYTGGLNLLDKENGGFIHFKHNPNDTSSLSNNNVYAILQDNHQNLWVGTYGGGLNVKKINDDKFYRRYSKSKEGQYHLNSDEIRTIYLDTHDNLWVGTENGLHVKWSNADSFEVFLRDENNLNSISSNVVLSIYEDQKGRLWIGTSAGGLNQFRYDSKDFLRINHHIGLPGNNIVGIAEDNGLLWLSTNKGICAYNADNNEHVNYNLKDGLNGNEFSIGAVCRSVDGELLFGGTHGISSFYPHKMSRSNFIPKTIFSKIRLHNKLLTAQDHQLDNHDVSIAKQIHLNYNENNISVEFSVLNYITPDKNKYAYRLVGLEDDWTYVDVPTATYTNLSPGRYILQVKGATNDGVWSDQIGELEIFIASPWWATWWAYLLYSIIFGVIIVLVIRFVHARRLLKYELHVQQLQAANDKKIADLKANFYTHISHELRTPLTLILGPVHQLLSDKSINEKNHSTLQVVRKNAQRLLRLVNELLDSRKTELGLVKLQVKSIDINKLIQEVIQSFIHEIKSRNITIDQSVVADVSDLWLDDRQIEKVFFNLIGNALRFAPMNGKIWIHVTKIQSNNNWKNGGLQIEVKDNGPGIPKDDLPYIFQLFYQGKSSATNTRRYGSGMGLSLTKDIVKLHSGDIYVNSLHSKESEESYTSFVIKFPLGTSHFDKNKVDIIQDYISLTNESFSNLAELYGDIQIEDENIIKPVFQENCDQEQPLILLIDDNEDILDFLVHQLKDKFRVIKAFDGEQGWNIIQNELPDIVISDVMMPNIDGASLSSLIKKNENTAHIPILLLTALGSENDMLVGMQSGADDYLTKPINIELLLIKIQNILFTKQSAKRRFIRKYMLNDELKKEEEVTEDQLFLNRIVEIINNRLSSSELNVVQLSSDLGMSRPVLYKKIKQLTGMSIIELINVLRLRKATELFENSTLGVSDVAYQVGYSDPKYFSKTFKTHYGVTPKLFSEMNATEKARLIDENKLFDILQN